MKKRRLLFIILLFIFLTSLETGIMLETFAHIWSGFGNGNIIEYNEAGTIGVTFLIFFIPISVILILLIRITLCTRKSASQIILGRMLRILPLYRGISYKMKKVRTVKELLLDCIYALSGIGITFGIIFIFRIIFPYRDNPILFLGRLIAAFVIDSFDWIDYVIP